MACPKITFAVDLKDLRFALFDCFRIQELFKYERFSHIDQIYAEDLLVQAERIAREVIFPLNKVADQTPPVYRDGKVLMPPQFHSGFKRYSEGGWIPLTLSRGSGGAGLPESLASAIKEIFNGASGGFYAFSSLTLGAMNLIDTFGTKRLKDLFLEKMAKGIYCGTMCLTEPDAGSYLADIKTMAIRHFDHFKIKGTKVFIGTGEHDLSENIVHCVLARIEGAPSGYKGISLFVVPKYRINEDGTLGPFNDVSCLGIERKMGHDGAPTATLRFGEKDDCHGWLLGEEGRGLSHMFQMMNELRLGTAIQGAGQAAAAYLMALSFAKGRIQGLSYKAKRGDPPVQVPIIQHPDVRRNLLFMKAIVEGCRRINILTALCIDLSKALPDERERQYYNDLAEILTPVGKSYCSDMGFRVTETAVQTMGGYGYIKDYHVEQYLRDIKPTSIYEGTNGIHAIDLTRRKLNIENGRLFVNLIKEMDKFINENINHPLLGSMIDMLNRKKEKMVELSHIFTGKKEEEAGLRFSMAKPFLDMVGHIICTWMLLKSAVVASSFIKRSNLSEGDLAFYDGKILTARFAVANLLPLVDSLAETINSRDTSLLDINEWSF